MNEILKKLVALEVQRAAELKAIVDAERTHIHPLEQKAERTTDQCSALWRQVLEHYGPGAAQDALAEARARHNQEDPKWDVTFTP